MEQNAELKFKEAVEQVKGFCDSTVCERCPFAAPLGEPSRCKLDRAPYYWKLEEDNI